VGGNSYTGCLGSGVLLAAALAATLPETPTPAVEGLRFGRDLPPLDYDKRTGGYVVRNAKRAMRLRMKGQRRPPGSKLSRKAAKGKL
jgi:hypothetical protein